jgi:sorbitol/mannitol transport system permease protein
MVGKTLMEGSQTMARCTNLRFSKIAWPVVAWIVGLIFSFPIFYMVMTSFKTDADAVNLNPVRLRRLENYANMTDNYDYWRFATNLITSVFATLFALVVVCPCAYSMAFSPDTFNQDILMDASTRCFHGMLPDDVPDEERSGP